MPEYPTSIGTSDAGSMTLLGKTSPRADGQDEFR